MDMDLRKKRMKLSKISLCLLTTFSMCQMPFALAAETQTGDESTQLNDVYIKGKKKATTKDHDITGLGKIVKDSDKLNSQQVFGIRDLIRYDPGVAVVEQGSGASVGYSIRGVDKNRVAVIVDSLPQSQSYVVQGQRPGSGAINEVELENITSVEISKGASSTEYGSNALGGSVAFRTKDPDDVIKEGKNWGLQAKSGYQGKTKQYANSLAFAGRSHGFEVLGIYTHKTGKETQINKKAYEGKNQEIHFANVYEKIYKLRGRTDQPVLADKFCILGEEPCEPKAKYQLNPRHLPDMNENFTAEELKQYEAMGNNTQQVSAKDYTGPNRLAPNPMDYNTDSYLLKLAYNFNQRHRIGVVFEDTQQQYDIHDMTVPAYVQTDDKAAYESWLSRSTGIYTKDGHHLDYIITPTGGPTSDKALGYRWTNSHFINEHHKKTRYGVNYIYHNEDKTGWLDHGELSYDRQTIHLDNDFINSNCSEYPSADKNCRPTLDKPWSSYEVEGNKYMERYDLFTLSGEKKIKFHNPAKSQLNLKASLGYTRFRSELTRDKFYEDYAVGAKYEYVDSSLLAPDLKNKYPGVDFYQKTKEPMLGHNNLCKYAGIERACETRTITGSNQFFKFQPELKINKYLSIGAGIRTDSYKFHTDDSWTMAKNFNVNSYNAGIVVRPVKGLDLMYRYSTGYRIPSFQEMFGFRVPGFEKGKAIFEKAHYVSDLEPEKATNQEIGLTYKGNFGRISASYYIDEYKDLISIADKLDYFVDDDGIRKPKNLFGYHNSQNMTLHGINISGTLDYNGIYDRIPEGFFSNFAYTRTKVKKNEYSQPDFTFVESYVAEAIQPSRYVFSLGYISPEKNWGNWGVEGIYTYSEKKRVDEINGKRLHHDGTTTADHPIAVTTPSWHTFDVTSFVKYKDLTMRAGIYNLFDYKYLTWESVRQSSRNAINQQKDVTSYARYAAPGRNFVLSAEFAF